MNLLKHFPQAFKFFLKLEYFSSLGWFIFYGFDLSWFFYVANEQATVFFFCRWVSRFPSTIGWGGSPFSIVCSFCLHRQSVGCKHMDTFLTSCSGRLLHVFLAPLSVCCVLRWHSVLSPAFAHFLRMALTFDKWGSVSFIVLYNLKNVLKISYISTMYLDYISTPFPLRSPTPL